MLYTWSYTHRAQNLCMYNTNVPSSSSDPQPEPIGSSPFTQGIPPPQKTTLLSHHHIRMQKHFCFGCSLNTNFWDRTARFRKVFTRHSFTIHLLKTRNRIHMLHVSKCQSQSPTAPLQASSGKSCPTPKTHLKIGERFSIMRGLYLFPRYGGFI